MGLRITFVHIVQSVQYTEYQLAILLRYFWNEKLASDEFYKTLTCI